MKLITNDAQVRAAKTVKASEDYKCGDSLYCRVFKSGKKTFRRIQKVGTSTAQITIGTFPDVSLAQAKNYNDYIREMAKRGHSPEQIKKALVKSMFPSPLLGRPSIRATLLQPTITGLWFHRSCSKSEGKPLIRLLVTRF